MLAGVTGAFLTGDIFNLYVWFEVLLIGSFGLLVLGGRKDQLEGALKYATLNLLATTFFFIATGLLYGLTGTLNMADLAGKVTAVENRGLVNAVAALYLLAFGMKAAAFPLFFWLPASYHTPQPGVSAIFGGLLTKVGVYALIRTFTLIFPLDGGVFNDALFWIAGLTILFGGMGALAQNDLRRLVAFTVVGGIGYMLAGLGLGTPAALSGGLFYMVHSMLISTGLFMAVGIAGRIGGGYDVTTLAGIYRAMPVFAGLFLLGAFIVAGIPPFTGFWPKVVLVQASLAVGVPWLTVAILIGGFLTTLALAKAYALAFWRDRPEDASPPTMEEPLASRLAPTAAIIVGAAVLGLYAGPLAGFTSAVAEALLDPAAYVATVLGGGA
jgi:multicomponent Na+:H+ antiporter subunit D